MSSELAYRPSVVTFVDILGFAELVDRGEGAGEIVEMLDAFDQTAGSPVGEVGSKTSVITFSDSVIRSRPLDGESLYEALLNEVQDLATAQWTLLEFGALIRGGMTVGDMALDGRRAFGPAFVRAYRLESSLANAPRIVIDPAVIEMIRAHLKTVPSRPRKRNLIEDLKSHLRLGDDGIWFIDYINSVSLLNGEDHVREALGKMRQFIIDKATSLHPSSLVLPKYLWLIRYHNQSVSRMFAKPSDLKIRSTDVPAADELLKPIKLKRTKA